MVPSQLGYQVVAGVRPSEKESSEKVWCVCPRSVRAETCGSLRTLASMAAVAEPRGDPVRLVGRWPDRSYRLDDLPKTTRSRRVALGRNGCREVDAGPGRRYHVTRKVSSPDHAANPFVAVCAEPRAHGEGESE